MAAKIRPVYCGNFEYDARQSEIERLFKEYGRVDRVDMKTGKFDFSGTSSIVLVVTTTRLPLRVLTVRGKITRNGVFVM